MAPGNLHFFTQQNNSNLGKLNMLFITINVDHAVLIFKRKVQMTLRGVIIIFMSYLLFAGCQTKEPQMIASVKIVGQMKNVMWKGQLYGTIKLDTIANKSNLYGLGPVEYLTGEILIMDGKSYKSTVSSDTTIKVVETYDLKAPFFSYANISKWKEQVIPDSIQTIEQLEIHLNQLSNNSPRPFMFKVSGTIEQATIHIVNLPSGSKVGSPAEAHLGQRFYKIQKEQAEILGFFSTAHKTIFTHHDTYLHMHLITTDKQKMGHLDKVLFKKGTMILFLPIG